MAATCDVCNASTLYASATIYSPGTFRELVLRGFGPGEAIIRLAATHGIPRETAIRQWTDDLVARSTTDWLLCQSCAERAHKVWSDAPTGSGNGPTMEYLEPRIVESVTDRPAPTRYCIDCGSPIAADGAFCPRCGHDRHPSFVTPGPISTVNSRSRAPWRTRQRLAVIASALGLFAIGAVLIAAGQSSVGPSVDGASEQSNAAASPSAPAAIVVSPSPSISAPLRAGAVADWGDAPITTVCLAGSQVYEQEPDFRFPVNTWVSSLLGPVGIMITGKSGPCDATLKVSIELTGTAMEYGTSKTTRYTGVDRRVTVSLTAADREPIVYDAPFHAAPSDLATNFDPTTPHEFLLSQYDDVARDVLAALTRFWGMAVAVGSLCLPDEQDPYLSFAFEAEQRLLDASDLRSALGTSKSVPNDYMSWRQWFETGKITSGDRTSRTNGCH
jgi:hypothetical protein